jgi:hypothetical protein
MDQEKNKMQKELRDLSREELLRVIEKLIIERDNPKQILNKISIADIEIESNVEDLNTCKNIANELIIKNQEFLVLRKNKMIMEKLGYIG